MNQEDYIVFIGTPCIDEYYEVQAWPKEGDKFLGYDKGPMSGGMIANAACVMAGFGVKTYCFCAMGKDDALEFLLKDLEEHHVDTSKIIQIENAKNTRCFIFQTEKDRTICVIPGDQNLIELTSEQLNFLANAKYIYSSLSNLKNIKDRFHVLQTLKEAGVKLVLDNEVSTYVKDWKDYMKYCYLASMNEHAISLYGEGKSDEELAKELLEEGVEIFVETLGSEGCKVFTQDETFSFGTYDVPVVDTTGAGDTFNTSFTYALSQGEDIKEAAQFASASANMSITKMGPRSGITDKESVLAFMKEHKEKE